VQPLPSPIPAVRASVFDVEEEPAPKPEPAEAALLESMSDPLRNKNRPADPIPTPGTPKEYPWQPIARPAAGPMATALRRAAEAAGRSEVDSSATSKTASAASVSDAPISIGGSYTSGQGAATARAKASPMSHQEAEMPQLDAPTFSSLGARSGEPASGKKTILIAAAVLVAAAAVGYVGWTKTHPVNETPVAQTQTAPLQTAPLQVQPPTPAAVSPSASPAQDMATPSQPANSATASPVEQGPDITLSTIGTRPPAPKKSPSIVAPNTVVRTPSDAKAPAPMVVRNEASKRARPSPAPEESAQPPAPGTLGVASEKNTDQVISGIMSTAAVNLPQPAQQLKVSQGVSQGLLIKSVEPVYPSLAKQMHIQGAVELLANIGKDGSITKVKLLSGDSVLSHAAIDAVKHWKYKPYYLNDQPVEIQTQITVKFKLP
jgi:periplasmic protein TonB